MWLMLQQDRPDDYMVGTGESHSVREFVEKAFEYAGIEIEWKGRKRHGKVRKQQTNHDFAFYEKIREGV